METYSKFAPTQFDTKGLGLDERQEWLVAPVSQTRDSGSLETSNFAAFLKAIGGESETVEVHRFGHWGPGWFEIILIDPADATAVQTATEMESSLEDYPVLDESDLSERENDAYTQSWEDYGNSDFLSLLVKHQGLSNEAEDALYYVPSDTMREYFESLIPSGDYSADEDGVSGRQMEHAAKSAPRSGVAQLIRIGHKARKIEIASKVA